ncbi:DUF3857 domain-containing protein [Bacteroides oleiciplenus]|uniref:DUF3857 domain-containing protein n=1 Tax=Bacteroides oleiciplenus YIT 12058 TaxID=742727 RepID=K9EJF8_9BACE|nr:DUF3857 domain-containing protein [Bacteroides oleiciplenus]EKU91087.1 hypothetical protein HMPREF9447_02505 [Bacteroides oleiciplenus YIT 12058]
MKMNRLFIGFLLQVVFYSGGLHAQTDLRANAYSIVQDAVTDIVCSSPTDAVQKEKRVIQILNEKGKEDASFICMCDRFSSLKKFSGEVRDASGNVIRKIKKSELKVTEYSDGLVSDDYYYFFEYTPSRYPVTITYEWEIKNSDGLIGYPGFFPQKNYNQAVAQASYRIITPADNPCRYRTIHMQAEVNQQQMANGNWLTEVKVQSLPAIKKEPYSPSLSELLPRIYFTPRNFSFEGTKGNMDSWQAYGAWQYQLLNGRDQLPPTLKEELQKRTANCNTAHEKIAAVYQYLASSTRYVSIQLGIGGLQPIAAADVHRTGFGDCKGLSNYMRAMLTELGIPSVYTVISTTNKRLLADFASANQNNHVILQVPLPNDTLWLECTNPTLPLGYVHHSIAGHDALLVGPNGGTLCQLPTYADSLNTQVNNARVSLQPDGSAGVEVKQTSRLFQYEDMASIIDQEPARQKDWLRSDINLIQAKVDAVRFNESKQKEPQLGIFYTIESGQYGNKTGKRLFIPANIFHKDFYSPNGQGERTQVIQINYGYLDIDSISIRLPEEYEIESLPKTADLESKFGKFHSSITLGEGRNVFIVHRLQVYQGNYPKEEYPDFLNFRKNVATQYGAKIILKRTE